jgi:hypothetical protein
MPTIEQAIAIARVPMPDISAKTAARIFFTPASHAQPSRGKGTDRGGVA